MRLGRMSIRDARTNQPLEVVDAAPTWVWRSRYATNRGLHELVIPQMAHGMQVGEVTTGIFMDADHQVIEDGREPIRFDTDEEARAYALTYFLLGDGYEEP